MCAGEASRRGMGERLHTGWGWGGKRGAKTGAKREVVSLGWLANVVVPKPLTTFSFEKSGHDIYDQADGRATTNSVERGIRETKTGSIRA